jgi:Rrf2 family transcriptional regulator, nitric oxide-sensitive transcriptional repressor
MLKLNRKVEYAMIALKAMSQKAPGQLTTAKEICDTYHIPFAPTARVLQVMAQKGVLKAAQGAYGGYQITKDLSKVSVGHLYDMIEGPLKISSCSSQDHAGCDLNKSCNLIGPIRQLNEKISDLFYTINLSEFLGGRPTK